MTQHDVASLVGQALGMPGAAERAPLTPRQLAERFTAGEDPDGEGRTIARGFCGYSGSTGAGFDDGYDFLGTLNALVPAPRVGMQPAPLWRAISERGAWPYHVFATCGPHGDDPMWTIAEYIEGDLVVRRFASQADAERFWTC